MGTVDNFKHCCRFIGSFRGTLRATPTIAVFTRLFLKARYKVDTVEPCYYGRWGAGGAGGGGGYRKCPYKKFVSPFLPWDDFHAHSRFARSTIPEGKWGTTRSLVSTQTTSFGLHSLLDQKKFSVY